MLAQTCPAPRFLVGYPISFKEADRFAHTGSTRPEVHALSMNLSHSGICFQLQPGSEILLKEGIERVVAIHLETDEIISLNVRVVWINDRGEGGLEILSGPCHHRRNYETLLDSYEMLEGDAPSQSTEFPWG